MRESFESLEFLSGVPEAPQIGEEEVALFVVESEWDVFVSDW